MPSSSSSPVVVPPRKLLVTIEADEAQPLRELAFGEVSEVLGEASSPGSQSIEAEATGDRHSRKLTVSHVGVEPSVAGHISVADGGGAAGGPMKRGTDDSFLAVRLLENSIARELKVPPPASGTGQGKCWVETLLVRPVSAANNDTSSASDSSKAASSAGTSPGLVACHLLPRSDGEDSSWESSASLLPNVRATRLAMACGLLSIRFYGTVVLRRTPAEAGGLAVSDVKRACCVSPDLRRATIGGFVPEWLTRAAQHNYHDQVVIQRLARAMNRPAESDDSSSSDEDLDDNGGDGADGERDGQELGEETNVDGVAHRNHSTIKSLRYDDPGCTVVVRRSTASGSAPHEMREKSRRSSFVARTPLCLACRKPSSSLCSGCHGAYFCSPHIDGPMGGRSPPLSSPSPCQVQGWSHNCWCGTWKRYVSRRSDLSTFAFLGSWVDDMTGRDCQLSQSAYEDRLSRLLGITATFVDCAKEGVTRGAADNEAPSASNMEGQSLEGSSLAAPQLSWRRSWWRAEYGAWDGGGNPRAREIDVSVRDSYLDGFFPLPAELQPLEKPILCDDLSRLSTNVARNALGFVRLQSWGDYYKLREIPASSPAALLLSFPLTLYHAIVEYGDVPSTVAHGMLRRALRIHIVGAEKELFFLDMFRETAFLLGADDSKSPHMQVELVFVVRGDMVPPLMQASIASNDCSLVLSENLTVRLVSGSYGDPTSLDPNFDCGSGPPDMIVAFNAGLYAYESWRSVVTYLDRHRSVVGVFTDYNEMSAVQCAGLGGPHSRESVTINPFRQPRAMPVYSMNLPQFSNGFFYVYNQQSLE